MERSLLRSQAERRRRRLVREAYASVYRRIAHLVPILLPVSGQVHTLPIEGLHGDLVEALAASCVFGFETAFEVRTGRRLLNAMDVHAYTTDAEHPCLTGNFPGLGSEAASPRLVPSLPRPPYLWIVAGDVLPPAVKIGGRQVVSGEWMLREYLGALGHRFDLLAVVLKCVDDEGRID